MWYDETEEKSEEKRQVTDQDKHLEIWYAVCYHINNLAQKRPGDGHL